jgi:hypothetical protein
MSAHNPIRLRPFKFSTTTCFMLELGHKYIRFYSNRQQVIVGGSPYQISSPYTALPNIPLNTTVVFQLQFTQIEDIIYITHPDFPVYALVRVTDTSWTLSEVDWLGADGSQVMPPMLDQNNSQTTITSDSTTGSANLTATDAIFQAGHVGSFWQIASVRSAFIFEQTITGNGLTSAPFLILGNWTFATYGVWSSSVLLQRSDDGGTTWKTILTVHSAEDANYNVPGTAETQGLYQILIGGWSSPVHPGATTPRAAMYGPDAFIFGLVQITGYTSPTQVAANVLIPLNDTNPTVYWSEGAFSAVRGYPKASCSLQQRLWFGGTTYEPQRNWGSMTGDLENFDRTDTTLATSSIAIDLAADTQGPIYWLATGLNLFVGLAGAEWVVSAPDSTKGITTSNIQAVQHSQNGSAEFVPAMPVGDALIYCERRAKSLMQMMFSIGTSKYMSQKLTVLANHITKPGIVQMDVQQQFDEQIILWAVTSDGRLVGLTYDLEQEVIAWHQHNTGLLAGDIILSVGCCYGDVDSIDDDVYVAVQRQVGGSGVVFVEILSTTDWQEPDGDPNTAIYCDCAFQFINPGSTTLTGLSVLNGRTVVAVVNGMVLGRFTVSGGSITVPDLSSVEGEVIVTVGIDYESDIQPVSIDRDDRLGITQAEQKTIGKVYPIFLNTLGGLINVGNADVPVPVVQNPDLNGPPIFINGMVEVPVNGPHTRLPVLIVKQTDPLPLTLLALNVEYSRTGTP